MRKIYLDNSATTPVDREVLSAMSKYWSVDFANPSSIHGMGVKAKVVLQKSRETIAKFINAHSRELFFTSGGTESNNLAIFGLINSIRKEGKKYSDIHVITTEIEHSSILECFKELSSRGAKVDYLKVNEYGLINPKDLREMITSKTLLISVGYANSEIGVIEPIKEIIKEIRHFRKENGGDHEKPAGLVASKFSAPYLHIDASQAGLYLNMNVEELGVDLMTLDAQKMYGPKGVGALYIRDGIKISPIIFGGGQEKGIRSGTENIPLIVGFAKTVELAGKNKIKESERLTKIRNYFFENIKKFVPDAIINGCTEERLPNNINISIPGQDGEMLVFRLDEAGFIVSSSSACASGSGESEVVKIISGGNFERAKSTLRFSMGRDTKIEDIKKLLVTLKNICQK
jgi:cysteine desulfurase